MSIRAKFLVDAIEQRLQYNGSVRHTVKMSPVSGNDSDENRKFWEATPSGKLEIGHARAEGAAQFEIGAEYYVDFRRAGESS